MASSVVYNTDCMEYLKTVPDKFFDLAVCDPPYGGGAADADTHTHTHTHRRTGRRTRRVQGSRHGALWRAV